MKRLLMATWLTLACAGLPCVSENRILMSTVNGDLELVITGARVAGGEFKELHIEGYVSNRSRVDVRYVRVRLVFLDKIGAEIEFCSTPSLCTISFSCPETAERCDVLPVDDRGILPPAGPYAPVASVTGRLVSGLYYVEYGFDTATKDNPAFESLFEISVAQGISFSLRNRTEAPLEILWDQSSFVDVDGNSGRIIHSGVKYNDKEKPQPNTTIPPLAKISDSAFPADHVTWIEKEWSLTPLLPNICDIKTEDAAKLNLLVGGVMGLFLRLQAGDLKTDQFVKFKIASVSSNGRGPTK